MPRPSALLLRQPPAGRLGTLRSNAHRSAGPVPADGTIDCYPPHASPYRSAGRVPSALFLLLPLAPLAPLVYACRRQ